MIRMARAGGREGSMRNLLRALMVLVLASLAQPAAAQHLSAKQQGAFAMVKRVQDKFAASGFDAAVAAVNDPSTAEFHDGDLYPFIYDMSGVCLANGARPALVGKNLISLKDQDGKYLIREMRDIATGPG